MHMYYFCLPIHNGNDLPIFGACRSTPECFGEHVEIVCISFLKLSKSINFVKTEISMVKSMQFLVSLIVFQGE